MIESKHKTYYSYCKICSWHIKTKDDYSSCASVNQCGGCGEEQLYFVGMTAEEHAVFDSMTDPFSRRLDLLRELIKSNQPAYRKPYVPDPCIAYGSSTKKDDNSFSSRNKKRKNSNWTVDTAVQANIASSIASGSF